MTTLPLPADEGRRLEILKSYEILDTPPEAAFDDLVRLTSFVFHTPIALITLVDDHREWFKARVGLDQLEATKEGFCAPTVLSPNLFIIQDAESDPRFKQNPYVKGEPYIRFYAGAPLFTPEGPIIGTL